MMVDRDGIGGSQLGPARNAPAVSQAPSCPPLTAVIDGSVLDDALVAKGPELVRPTMGSVIECRGWMRARMYFGGVGTGGTVNYQVHIWYESRNRAVTDNEGVAYWPEKAASGVFTLGTKTYGAGGIGLGATTTLIADEVTDTVLRQGTVINSPADNTQASIDIVLENAAFIQIETDLAATATSADVFLQFGDDIVGGTDAGIGTPAGTAGSKIMQIGGIAEETVPTAVTDGQGVAAWYNLYGQNINPSHNLSLDADDVNDVAPALTQYTKNTGITQLTAPGSTADVVVSGMGVYGYTLTVAAINTTVVVSLTGTIDGTNYATLPMDNSAVPTGAITTNQLTVTANGTYVIYSSAPVDEARLTFVSETGGTAATISADFFGRRK